MPDPTPEHETEHAPDCWKIGGSEGDPCTCGAEEAAALPTWARDRIAEIEHTLTEALELLYEYECQWGNEYLAEKWKLKERRAALVKKE